MKKRIAKKAKAKANGGQIKAESFCYWLQGFAEMRDNQTPPTEEQWAMIIEHLGHVFTKVTKSLSRKAQPNLDVSYDGVKKQLEDVYKSTRRPLCTNLLVYC